MELCSYCRISDGEVFTDYLYLYTSLNNCTIKDYWSAYNTPVYLCDECKVINEAKGIKSKLLEMERAEKHKQKKQKEYEEALQYVKSMKNK